MKKKTSLVGNILLVGQKDESVFLESKQFFQQLALLWKFKLETREFNKNRNWNNYPFPTHIIITYSFQDASYEEWCCDILENLNIKKALLVDHTPKVYDLKFRQRFNIQGIKPVRNKKLKVFRRQKDILTSGIPCDMTVNRIFNEYFAGIRQCKASCLLEDEKGHCLLSKQHSNYCLSISRLQIGLPIFPAIFTLLRNFIFFSEGIGFFSPSPFVSLRVDDYPLTSQQYLKSNGVSDINRFEEISTLCSWADKFGVKLEFMVNSAILRKNGNLQCIKKVVPKSVDLLRQHYRNNNININAHGRSHINENNYLENKEISPFEFSDLNEKETENHLLDNITFIKKYFGKAPVGFVPPSWGYLKGVTKKVCAQHFSFIIDSSQNYMSAREEAHCLGYVDKKNTVHLIETWHLGSRKLNYGDKNIWKSYLNNGIPIHMMSHGLYIYDPLPPKKTFRLLFLIILLFSMPLLFLFYPKEVLKNLKAFQPSIKWGRLEVLRKILIQLPYYKNASLYNLLHAGKKYGAQWVFTEDLAKYLREYNFMDIMSYHKKEEREHSIQVNVTKDITGPFFFHSPCNIQSAMLDEVPIFFDKNSQLLEIKNLDMGVHSLLVRTN